MKTHFRKRFGAVACLLAFGIAGTAAEAAPLNVFSDDFSGGGLPAGFSGAGSVEDAQGYKGLGGFADNFLRNDSSGNPAAATILTLIGLPAHDTVSLDFLLAVIDSWDGAPGNPSGPDFFNVEIDGVSIFSESYANVPGHTQSASITNQVIDPTADNGFTNDGFFFNDSGYDMGDLAAFNDIAHTGNTLVVEWFASGAGWQGGSDESWAIDNVSVTINTTDTGSGGGNGTSVPEPGALSLFGMGMAGLSWLRRRRKAQQQ